MKRKLLIVFFLFLYQIGISQTGRFVYGKVVNNEAPIKGVEVISLNTKKNTITDRNGHFSIIVNPKDILIFVSKHYETKRVSLDSNHFENYDFTITLTQKKEQLEEVVITSIATPRFDSQKIVDGSHFYNLQSSPKNRLIYDGTIENGIDFVRIYKDVQKKLAKE
ncbi:carboxypeptidase-like regulatory domain-containing protein [Flavobacterium sp.]|uniref:carboxypeptidase-like regulatory domain-containing protein n=1 Tax=Flavobacterium sp. TaxID=239 RepID=UPI0037500FA6